MKTQYAARFPLHALRVWHGMTTGVWLRMMFGQRFSISPSQIPLAASITAVSGLNSFAALVENLLYRRRASAITVRPPLFIVGHWRTGTTLLHELLVQDARFNYPTLYRCMAPHHFLHTEWYIAPGLKWLLPEGRPTDNMPIGLQRPQEDEFALCNLGVPSPYLSWAFPGGNGYETWLDLRELPARDREAWKRAFAWFLRRMTVGDSRRLVLKSPTHTARLQTLLELFPDAQFVHTVRDPFATVPSTLQMWRRMEDWLKLEVGSRRNLEDYLFELAARMYRCFEEDRQQLGSDQICDVRFEQLTASPVETVQQIYEQLQLGEFEPVRPRLEEYADRIKGHRPGQYDVPPDLQARISRHWADYLDRYDYRFVSA